MGKVEDRNAEQLARFNKIIKKKEQSPKIETIQPTGTKPLHRSKEQAKKTTNAGRKKIPENEKRKHQIALYLTDDEYKYLHKKASQHYIGNAKMLRVLINEAKILIP